MTGDKDNGEKYDNVKGHKGKNTAKETRQNIYNVKETVLQIKSNSK